LIESSFKINVYLESSKNPVGKKGRNMCRYAIKNSLKPIGKNKDKISMAYVDYCLIVNSYGKNLGRKTHDKV